MTCSKSLSWTWAFEEGILTVGHDGATVSLGRYATHQFAAKAAALYIQKHAHEEASLPVPSPKGITSR
jgi:hypothetical protein